MSTKTATKSSTKTKTKKKTNSVSNKTNSKKASAKTAAKTASKKTKSSPASSTKKAPKKSTSVVRARKSKIKGNGNGAENRAVLIQQMAYYIAEKRGFEGGDPVQDWLTAERQVDQMLKENRV